MEWYQKAADQGHGGAQNNLGLLYETGDGVARDLQKAHALYLAAAKRGMAEAQFNVGFNFATGMAVTQDWHEAAVWYRKADAQGHRAAANNLGNIYLLGRGVPADSAAAEPLLRKAAEVGYPPSQLNLGLALFNQGKVQEAAIWVRRSAERGNAGAQAFLAEMLTIGKGVVQDRGEAMKWARKAATAGLPDGQAILAQLLVDEPKADPAETVRLARLAGQAASARGMAVYGICYHRGLGVTRDLTQAAHWYRRSAEAKHVDGAVNLAVLLESGLGVARDYAEAARWYRVGAEAGDPTAQYRLGILYRDGTGVKSDILEAVKWLRPATQKLDDPAVRNALAGLERLINQGAEAPGTQDFLRGLTAMRDAERGNQDFTTAVEALEKASAAGHSGAQAFLGGLCRRGRGVPRDEVRAEALLAEAAKSDDGSVLFSIGMAYVDQPDKPSQRAIPFFRRAAVQGNPLAQNALGSAILNADGERDLTEACKWLMLAERAGALHPKENLLRVRRILPIKQIDDAERQADAFRPGPDPKGK